MRELYGIKGLKYVIGLVLAQLLSFFSLLVVCVLFWLKVNNYLTWPWWLVSLPLFVFYPSAAALIGLLWEGLSGSLFRLDLLSLPTTYRRLFFPLLGLCVIAAVQLHLLLVLRSGNNPDYFNTLILALPFFVLGTGTLLSFWILRLVRQTARKKAKRGTDLTRLLKNFGEQFDALSLRRVKEFVFLESGKSRSNPPTLIRGAVFPGLSSKRWYDTADFKWAQNLEASYKTIEAEVLAINERRVGFEEYSYPGLGKINWQSFVFFKAGKKIVENCARCPETTKLLETVPGSLRREAMFSVLEPGVRIPPHRDSGNQLLTCHLGLIIPPHCGLRVGGETRVWEKGKCLIFDTSYEHEAWNSSDESRIVLLIDFWHPELSEVEKQFLEQMDGLGYW